MVHKGWLILDKTHSPPSLLSYLYLLPEVYAQIYESFTFLNYNQNLHYKYTSY